MCISGLQKARECRLFDFDNFDIAEYEFYEQVDLYASTKINSIHQISTDLYSQVENGDLNWIQPGKFIGNVDGQNSRNSNSFTKCYNCNATAFAGPHGSRDGVEGYRMLTPDDYVSYFKKKQVTLVVRLNKKYYDAK